MSQLKVNSIVDAAGGSSAVLYGVASPPNSMGFRNRIINGGMVIDQRNAGASVSTTTTGTNVYTIDRFLYNVSAASKFTIQQNAAAITPPSGFSSYLGCTSTSAYSVGAAEQFLIGQFIEGLNFSDLAWGTAAAQAVTLSFWVRSSLTGTFGGAVVNNAFDRNYPFSYTISAANIWEQKTVTITGDTTGTWLATSGIGARLYFSLGAGASSSGPAGAWAAGGKFSATGAVSVVGTSGATFYITGVQLEAGSVASSFERRDYGRELMMCQRYFEASPDQLNGGIAGATGTQIFRVFYKVTKRTSATATPQGAVGGTVGQAGVDGFLLSRTNDNPFASAGYTAAAEL